MVTCASARDGMGRFPGTDFPETILATAAGHQPLVVRTKGDLGAVIHRQLGFQLPAFDIPNPHVATGPKSSGGDPLAIRAERDRPKPTRPPKCMALAARHHVV